MFTAGDYLDLAHTAHTGLFPGGDPVWNALGRLASHLESNLKPAALGAVHPKAVVGDRVFIGEGTVVEPGAVVKGPAWIGKNCQIRSGCYIRENVIVGDGCVLGNSCEFKNCILFDACEVPHFNYVGDAILGHKAHLGAGVILSNVRLDRGEVIVKHGLERIGTGMRKFSAIIGDHAEIGCNSVINPGSLIGRRCVIHPLANFSGVLPEDMAWKVRQTGEAVPRARL
jgi:UDP-N-acetylglucosamine diphosphorylase / glucose-1-phosphate thymidylyltransferase / UDP-N-acetylgalactosamine diphosphorylase / glucosamine-1-phosphate N-acetyltransferase / galactosamine-1-phosphate N-acetyltransferase